jgi:urease accessory protein UreF
MANQRTAEEQIAESFLGDVAPLLAQIGSTGGLVSFRDAAGSVPREAVTDAESLGRFLAEYRRNVLLPLELPSICRAYQHASRFEVRELIELDRRLGAEPLMQEFASASRRVGKTQLKRLRPLRDQRLVQRYLGAVQAGQAHAWHTLVYGLILAVYSLPLRQGLLSYARQTTRGFIDAAARHRELTSNDCQRTLETISAELPGDVERILSVNGFNFLTV